MSRWLVWSLPGVLMLAAGCKQKNEGTEDPGTSASEPGEDATPPCELDGLGTPPCNPWGCGSNSPVLGAGGFDLENKSPETWKIVSLDNSGRPTIQKGPWKDPTVIEAMSIKSGKLLAGGKDLHGSDWWFGVQKEKGEGKGKRKCEIHIRTIGTVDPWYGGRLTTYRLKVGPKQNGPDLCPQNARWGRSKSKGSSKGPSDTETHAALIVKGERYDEHSNIKHHPSWFTIACAGSALAKMKLVGLDPERDPTQRAERQTLLKLLTATYNERCETEAWTTPGVPLKVSKCKSSNDCPIELVPDSNNYTTQHEAYWGPKGAACFDHTRLFSGEKQRSKTACAHSKTPEECDQLIRDKCGLKPCKDDDRSAWSSDAIRFTGKAEP